MITTDISKQLWLCISFIGMQLIHWVGGVTRMTDKGEGITRGGTGNTASGGSRDPESLRVLLVEDNPGDARLVQEYLDTYPFAPVETQTVDRLELALEVLERRATDLIIVDLGLPDADGLTAIETLRHHHISLPIVVLTGMDDSRIAFDAIRLGAQEYIPKQHVNEHNLHRSVRNARERYRLVQELEEALTRVKQLQSLIPICAGCKKIRNDEGYWQDVTLYIREHAGVEFSHGLCPDCVQQMYPELYQNQKKEQPDSD